MRLTQKTVGRRGDRVLWHCFDNAMMYTCCVKRWASLVVLNDGSNILNVLVVNCDTEL